MSEQVNHPSHYASGKIEVIEALEDWCLDFHSANAVKYIARAGKKDPAKEVEDLEKAVWYLKRKIENLKAVKENREKTRPNDMNPRSISAIDASSLKAIEAPGAFADPAPSGHRSMELKVRANHYMCPHCGSPKCFIKCVGQPTTLSSYAAQEGDL